jgi:hypothetical protein
MLGWVIARGVEISFDRIGLEDKCRAKIFYDTKVLAESIADIETLALRDAIRTWRKGI